MTENEALKLGKSLYENITSNANNIIPTKEYIEFVGMVIKALEEIQQYRAIGTIEEFKALKEKSVAKKPLPKGTHKGIDNFYCSNCNHPLTNRHEQCELPYCEICGQKLDWSE